LLRSLDSFLNDDRSCLTYRTSLDSEKRAEKGTAKPERRAKNDTVAPRRHEQNSFADLTLRQLAGRRANKSVCHSPLRHAWFF
jgi:hypothetical protein